MQMNPSASLVIKALDFASYAHRDQKRKHTGMPYIIHPVRLAERLRELGCTDENMLCAAILHDTLEDTSADAKEMSVIFGDDILFLVKQLTRDKNAEKGMIDVSHITDARAMLVKIVDRIDNMQDYARDQGTVPEKYVAEARIIRERALELRKGTLPSLKTQLGKAIELLEKEIER